MKRLIAFLGVALILIGLRLYDVGLSRLAPDGILTVFANNEYDCDVFMPDGTDCYRIDLIGEQNVDRLLKEAFAVVKLSEMEGRLIYAYSPRIPRSEWVHGKKVNLMIYIGEGRVSLGIPILKGSF